MVMYIKFVVTQRISLTNCLLSYMDPLSYTLDVGYGTMEVNFVTDSGGTAKGFRMIVYFSD